MGRSCAVYLLLGLLAPAAGCQLISRENLALGNAENSSGSQSPAELPPKATAEVCWATADALDRAAAAEKNQAKKQAKEAEAIALYEKARKNGSNKQQISRRLAYLYEQQGDLKHALDEYKQLVQRNPKDADLLNDIGYCYYNQGDWAGAEKHLRQAVAINPNHARAWINLGMTLAQTHHTAESLETFAKVVSPAQAQCNLAFILTTQGKFEEAKAAYRQALDLEPDLGLARGALAKLERSGNSAVPAPTTPAPVPAAALRNLEAAPERLEEQTPVEVRLP